MNQRGALPKTLIAIMFCITSLSLSAQCPKTVLFYKGKFYPKIYTNNNYLFTIPAKGYTSCNGLLAGMMDSLVKKDLYTYEGEKDSIQVCSWLFNIFSDGGKWAFFSFEGQQKSPFIYDYAYSYQPQNHRWNDYAPDHQLALVRIAKNWGLTTGTGKVLSGVEYQLPACKGSDTLSYTMPVPSAIEDSAGRCVDCKENNKVFPMAGPYIVFIKNGKAGALDTSGKVIIPFLYDSLFYSLEGCLEGSKGGKHVYLTRTGKEITGYDEVHPVLLGHYVNYKMKRFFSGIYLVKKKDMWGLVNSTNNQRIKTLFKIDSDGGHLEEEGELFSDAFILNKVYYDLQIKLNFVSIKDEMGKEVLGSFIEK
jgi:hypothetical protein